MGLEHREDRNILANQVLFQELPSGDQEVAVASLAHELERALARGARRAPRGGLYYRHDRHLEFALNALSESQEIWRSADTRQLRVWRDG